MASRLVGILVVLWLIPGLASAQATPGSSDACTPANFTSADLPGADMDAASGNTDTFSFGAPPPPAACGIAASYSMIDSLDVVYGFVVAGSPTGSCTITCSLTCAWGVTPVCDDTLNACVVGDDTSGSFTFSSLAAGQHYLWVDEGNGTVDVTCSPTVPVELQKFEID